MPRSPKKLFAVLVLGCGPATPQQAVVEPQPIAAEPEAPAAEPARCEGEGWACQADGVACCWANGPSCDECCPEIPYLFGGDAGQVDPID